MEEEFLLLSHVSFLVVQVRGASSSMVLVVGTVLPFERSKIDAPGPCVLFATPGMLSGGLSLEVFKHWAPSEANMIILPGWVDGFKLPTCNLSRSFVPRNRAIRYLDE